MASLMRFCQLLAEEGYQAQEYVEMLEQATNVKAKKDLKKIISLSKQKMRILHGIIKGAPWNFDQWKK